jgi:hypothetical protein
MKTVRHFFFLFSFVLLNACTGNATNNDTTEAVQADSPAAASVTPAGPTAKTPVPPPEKATTSPTADLSQEEKATAPDLSPTSPATPAPAAQQPTVTEQVSTATTTAAPQQEEAVAEAAAPIVPVPPSHDAWNTLLQQYVSNTGVVNYKGLKNSQAQLDAYLESLAANPIQDSWSRNEKMAYWINAYNAYTVKLIVDNYPTSSITKLKGGKPWDVKWIKLGDQTYSLNNIENDILRPQYKDARIHFAVNCAAMSCPPLLNQAWTASNLNRNFEKQAKAFINNPAYNTIAADQVQISKIFEWYAGDFGNIIDYLNQYSNTTINADAKVSYVEYDWALNE